MYIKRRNEKWKSIKKYKYYQVSNLGRIKSLERMVKCKNGMRRKQKTKILKHPLNTYGYPVVSLCNKYGKKQFFVHLLVLKYFGINKPSSRHICNHIDGNKLNSKIDNLEWVTPSENNKHAFKLGLANIDGENHPRSKLIEKEILRIRKLYKTGKYSKKYLADKFNTSQSNIYCIIKRINWKHI